MKPVGEEKGMKIQFSCNLSSRAGAAHPQFHADQGFPSRESPTHLSISARQMVVTRSTCIHQLNWLHDI